MRRHPLTWLLTGAVAITVSTGALMGDGVVRPLLAAAAALGIYPVVMRGLAGRPTPELAGAGGELLRGAATGAGFLLTSVAIVTLLGGYVLDWAPRSGVVATVSVAVGAAVAEELLFRGLAFQAIERIGGSRWALAVTAAFFGLAHLLNPSATLWSSAAIALEAGVLLGAAFLWRRNLWFCIGLHAAWNAAEGLLGIPVSGHREAGLWVTHPGGAAWLTGGSFGVEASVVTVVVSLALTAAMWRRGTHHSTLANQPVPAIAGPGRPH